jgi:membrane protease YdiL (CAAX protease family)
MAIGPDGAMQALPQVARGDALARRLRGFGPVGIVAALVILLAGNVPMYGLPVFPVGALLALLWARFARVPWSELGFARPRRGWLVTIALGIVFGVMLKLAMKALVMPLLGAPPVNAAYQFIAGNPGILVVGLWAMIVAGVSEEIVFRAFFFQRLRTLAGTGGVATAAIVIGSSLVFGLMHFGNQGWPGVQQATIVGLVFGTTYALSGRIWVPIVAHAAFDLTAFLLIYLEIEAMVAQSLFG